jgi:hypothetical protein
MFWQSVEACGTLWQKLEDARAICLSQRIIQQCRVICLLITSIAPVTSIKQDEWV